MVSESLFESESLSKEWTLAGNGEEELFFGGAIQRTPLVWVSASEERTDSSSGPNKMTETAPLELVSDSHGEFMKISDLINKCSFCHIPKGR